MTIWKSWLQAIKLIPLPEGVPEVLHVTCNGRSGLLLVRTQRVQHGESEISASKFEQVCGKGDAKKWKCSIWTEAEDGSQDMVGHVELSCVRGTRYSIAEIHHRKCGWIAFRQMMYEAPALSVHIP